MKATNCGLAMEKINNYATTKCKKVDTYIEKTRKFQRRIAAEIAEDAGFTGWKSK